ncbi:hypothetical protein [Hymenobacter sp.]|jgi:hypothetical protein|uniref:hypothetical protein n=1 Tax=Hymenobacter sp. TaxID=1898978 RepID=UPI002ED952E6
MLNPFRPKTVKTREQLAAELEAEQQAAAKAASAKTDTLSPVQAVNEMVAVATAVAKSALPRAGKTFDSLEQEQAQTAVQSMLLDLPELLGVAIIDIDSGQPIAKHAYAKDFSVGRAASCYANIVKQQRLALAALELPDEQLEEILITLNQQLHLIRVINDTKWLLYLSVNQKDTNISVAREVLRSHSV